MQTQANSGDSPQRCFACPLSCRCGLLEVQVPGGTAPWNIAAQACTLPRGDQERVPSTHTAQPGWALSPLTSALTGQNAAAGPDGGGDGRGAPAPPPGGTLTPQSSRAGWAPGRAGAAQ